MSERRCPSCGALVAADAEWCGQCLAPLDETTAASSQTVRATARARFEPGADAEGRLSVWRCPTCDARNGLDANRCRVCGTSFGRLFEEPAGAPGVSAAAAAGWSLLLPGLGHWLAGRRADAIARFVLAAWVVAMVVVLVVSRGGKDGLGAVRGLLALFALAAVALWAEAVIDARRAVEDLAPLVSSRTILWACVALVGVSVIVATILALAGVRSTVPVG
jgi:ribosomal protein L40E